MTRHQRAMRALAISILFVSSVAAASDDRLVGWSGDRTFYAVYGATCADPVVQLCPIKGQAQVTTVARESRGRAWRTGSLA